MTTFITLLYFCIPLVFALTLFALVAYHILARDEVVAMMVRYEK